MTPQPDRRIVLHLAFEPSAEDPADPATLLAVTHELVADLQSAGYAVQPAYTGTRSADVFEILHQIGQNIVDQQALLIALLSPVVPIVSYLAKQRERRAEPSQAAPPAAPPVKVSITVDGATITVEAPDVESAATLAERFQTQHPRAAEQVTAQSTVKVVGKVAAKTSRRRR